jgi:uncharacterized membrane protein YccC
MKAFLKKNGLIVLGTLIGCIGGFAYYYFLGNSIVHEFSIARPLPSMLIGAFSGGWFYSLFQAKATESA